MLGLRGGGDRTVDSQEEFIPGVELWGFTARFTGTIRRGQLYADVALVPPTGGSTQITLAKGYIHSEAVLPLGEFSDPTDGQGDTIPESIGDDIAGNVDTVHALAITNSIRRIDSVVWYYHCSADVAARTMSLRILAPSGTVPTGFDSGNDRQIAAVTGPALSANEDGIMYWNRFGYQVVVDNNVITIADNSTASNPFPMWIDVGDTDARMSFDVTDGEALDTYQAFLTGEIWIK